ncbi:SLBB domain-containing protein [cf. Phormidesmis sp. LEGE 11477]|uniref:SLBB domain-containing protein n=1 Tax=cf. Phormidesmis sp. LEGE 11477 TaxID=1828680 RepID=UPI0018807DD7|nr:SLBB domain-containing protein [cf. Phormidesmis sp. LEGE 11477]MBE9061348.1 SLBB domain-containing protein [cf. Phormidesmis sp. LEGE 11477]
MSVKKQRIFWAGLLAAISTGIGSPGLAQLDNAYTLGAGDTISIDIFNVPEYSGSQRVLADGSVNLPVVGAVNVSGLTPQTAGRVIGAAYQSELRYPQVTVLLEGSRPLRVAITGEVAQPGLYTMSSAEGAQLPTVAQALQTAGGVTQAADLRRVQLRRTNGQQADDPQSVQLINLDLWALLNNGDVEQDLTLRDGDAIVVHETSTVDITETNQLSASNLASSVDEEIVVAVVGEVFRPGAYRFGGGGSKGRTTVTEVVQAAGGVKPLADIRQIQVRRQTRNGSDQVIDLDFWQLLQSGDFSQDLVLQQGDTVSIPVAIAPTPAEIAQLAAANFSPDGVNVNIVGEVESPGQHKVPPDTTLSQVVLAAGGFNRRATETVKLIRFNPDGTVTQRQIEVDLTEGIDSEKNPLILNNDVVVVGRNIGARFTDSVDSILGPVRRLLPLSIFLP